MTEGDAPDDRPARRGDGPAAVDLTIVIPAFNEAGIIEETLTEVVAALRARSARFEVLVVENGSTDETAAIVGRVAQTTPEVRLERLERADYGRALRHGLLRADADVVVNFDADYFDFGFLDAATARVGPGRAAIVVGSKRAAGSNDTRPALRRLVTGVFSGLLRVGFGLGVSDTHGMKALDRRAVLAYAQQCRFGTDLFDTELVLRVERAGLDTAEIPVAVSERRPARTSILARAPRALLGLGRLRVALWRER